MDRSHNKKKESGLFGKGQRYWSVMLVGEHGRIVPFHRFKEVALAVIGLAIISLSALLVLSFLYIQQGKTLSRLELESEELRQTAALLRDEKDVLKAKLVRKEIHTTPNLSKEQAKIETTASRDKGKDAAVKSSPTVSEPAKPAVQKAAPAKATPVPVNWSGDIRMFEVDYNSSKKILQTKFRIYNTSVPKRQLAGRIAVVYKNSDDPPIKWLVVPHVPLKDGKPLGDAGKPFAVRNYRTMQFLAYGIPAPIKYNIVTVFVFRENGDLLLTRDYGITIETEPVPTPTPTPTSTPTPTPTPKIPEKPTSEPVKPTADTPQEEQPVEPSESGTPDDESSSAFELPQVTNSPNTITPSVTPNQMQNTNEGLPAGSTADAKNDDNPAGSSGAGQLNQTPQKMPEGDGQ